MKKILGLFIALLLMSNASYACNKCTTNVKKQTKEQKILLDVQKKTAIAIEQGKGPFFAVIYDDKNNIVAEAANSVVQDKCCLYHAEVNAIKAACAKLQTYDLAPYNLSIYVNAEPCMMCAGAIMWSGIKNVYYGVPSNEVERITGFDEGFKPQWVEEFAKRGIKVQGNIEECAGKAVLESYMKKGNTVYKPTRDADKCETKKSN